MFERKNWTKFSGHRKTGHKIFFCHLKTEHYSFGNIKVEHTFLGISNLGICSWQIKRHTFFLSFKNLA